jgi:phosphonate transport system substrate-binding protein
MTSSVRQKALRYSSEVKKFVMQRYGVLGSVLLLCFASLAHAQTDLSSTTPLSFGIVPQQATIELVQRWHPLLTYLSARTGYTILFKTAKDIPTFEQRLAAGEYDLAYMNPYHYVTFHQQPGYMAFAKEKDTQLQGLLVVRADSPYATLAELAGQTMAFPAPAAFAASVLPQAHLAQAGIPFSLAYVASHDSVYRGVAQGLFAAGGGITRTFVNLPPDIRGHLRLLWSTPPYTPHAFAAHPRLPALVVERVQQVMAQMHQDPDGLQLLQALHFKGIEPAQDQQWNDVRALELHLFQMSTEAPH